MEEEATKVNGFTDETVSKHPSFSEQWEGICEWISDNYIVIQNANFDWSLILDHVDRYDLTMPSIRGVLCSQRSAQPWAMINNISCSEYGPSLDKLTKALGCDNERELNQDIHGALVDARQTGSVVQKLVSIAG